MEKISDQELLDLIDEKLSVERAKRLMDIIKDDKILKERFDIMKLAHQQLSGSEAANPSEGFADRVMSNLHSPQYAANASFIRFSKGNLFTFLTIFGGILVGAYILATGIVTIPFFDQITVQPLNLQGTEIDVNPLFDGLTSGLFFKAFLMVDIVLAWFLLDRMVLKPYFESRRKRMAY